MNALSLTNNPALTMSSREISQFTNKEHFNVVRDIKKLFVDLGLDALNFEGIYLDAMNRKQTEYLLDRDLTDCLLTGYSAIARMAVIKRWRELEDRPLSKLDILQIAMESEKGRLKLAEKVEQDAPKVAFHDQVAAAPDTISVAKAAKVIGTGRNRLLTFLRMIHWITKSNEPLQAKITSGYLDSKLGDWTHPDHGIQQSITTVVTGKGLTKLQQLWAEAH